ncbi:gephyrin-like molybdotransferase Glp [Coleofasciculus sp. LEGE 07081]|uniref:molybdopterin molybdotransferase MoeA n=1 Tax=unclassified Coleofasciculus TaxID=2692782 RepID=UPI00187E6478|nr:molybdopterin molybdotransferase MoeA [Coleofasciculus sp. LEGE 07081]MBE9151081.1 molybdopterin molybdotransferase MoeA [Coleofasciculus sp. LEGE 07092]
MLPVNQAESIILELVQPLNAQLDIEIVDLSIATGRILASPVTSQLDFPHWDNSAMDGYAVRHADVQSASEQQPARLEIVEEIPAGYQPQQTIQPGQAARIFTGACMPDGADTVIMQENTKGENNGVLILQASKPQAFVRHRASFYQAGTPLLNSGIQLGAPEIAVLAAAQCTQLTVYRRPRVAIFSTGNELVMPNQPLQPGQIVDSNQYALAAFVTLSGGIPIPLRIVPDTPEALEKAIAHAISSADIVLSTGGVSVGDYDYVEQILAQLGAEIHIRSVAVKPGKPLTVAQFPALSQKGAKRPVLYFGLPGNPVSALVSCWRFVQPALAKLSGLPQAAWKPRFVKAIAFHELRADGRRETYLWGQLQLVDGCYEFHLAGGSHSSGNLINLAQTTGLAVVPCGQTLISAGESVQVLQLDLLEKSNPG